MWVWLQSALRSEFQINQSYMMRLYLLFIYLFWKTMKILLVHIVKISFLGILFSKLTAIRKKNRVEQYLVDKGHHKQQKNEMHHGYFKSTVLWKGADENGCSHLFFWNFFLHNVFWSHFPPSLNSFQFVPICPPTHLHTFSLCGNQNILVKDK